MEQKTSSLRSPFGITRPADETKQAQSTKQNIRIYYDCEEKEAIRGSLCDIMRKTEEAQNNDNIIRIYHECEGGMGKAVRGSMFGIMRKSEEAQNNYKMIV